ncbi:MAG TPA: hypothetical protein VET45_19585 [Candidatus Binatia bacterium]|nr:hypothetical protein [Candidatus Binatia bacterium]
MTPDSFFGTSLRRDPSQPADLNARIEAQLRERLEEAVDFVCLDALVKRRRALALPPPVADNPRDREEFTASVHVFLAELWAAIAPDLTEEQRQKVASAERAPADETQRLLGVHVALARELPDYWQRFEAGRTTYAEHPDSGRERRGLLDRLFGRG